MPISPYVRELRELVGKRRLLLPSVSVHIFDNANRVLLVRQSDGGVWSTPGGLVEPDERPVEAAVRETREETGLIVRPDRIVGAYGGPALVVRYPNGDETQYVCTAIACTVTGGEQRPDGDETIDVRYWSRAEADELPLAPWLKILLPTVFSSSNGSGSTVDWWGPSNVAIGRFGS